MADIKVLKFFPCLLYSYIYVYMEYINFWGAGFSTSVARRKTVVQVGSLGGGGFGMEVAL